MSAFVLHTTFLTGRSLRSLVRIPAYLIINLIQPMIWLLLFGQLFKSVIDIPGFTHRSGDYLAFLTPGVVMMMALFGSAWAGTTFIEDMKTGVMARLLTAPTSRGALMLSILVYQAISTIIQTLIVIGLAMLVGARFDGGVTGVLIVLLAAVLLVSAFSALSNATALLARKQEALIAISQIIALPLMFLSSGIMDTSLSPAWVRHVAAFNPFEWAVIAGREALVASPDWATIWSHLGLLALLALVMGALATRAFRLYQRSV